MDIQLYMFWLQVVTTTLNITVTVPLAFQIISYICSFVCGICGSCADCNDRIRMKRMENKINSLIRLHKIEDPV